MPTPPTAEVKTWRPALGYRLILGIFGTGCLVASVLPWDDGTYYARDFGQAQARGV